MPALDPALAGHGRNVMRIAGDRAVFHAGDLAELVGAVFQRRAVRLLVEHIGLCPDRVLQPCGDALLASPLVGHLAVLVVLEAEREVDVLLRKTVGLRNLVSVPQLAGDPGELLFQAADAAKVFKEQRPLLIVGQRLPVGAGDILVGGRVFDLVRQVRP